MIDRLKPICLSVSDCLSPAHYSAQWQPDRSRDVTVLQMR